MNKFNKISFFCPFCGRKTLPYVGFKTDSNVCTMCGSWERHRILYYIYLNLFLNQERKLNILHFVPEMSIYSLLSKKKNIVYTCCDIFPNNFPFVKEIEYQNGMNLTYQDESFDFIIHNHVIEHVPDDKKFIKETLRVLKQNGILIFSFPYFNDKVCLEEITQSDEERLRLYGQVDHFRLYGKDFLEKLSDPSYYIEIIDYHSFITDEQINSMKSFTDSDMFIMIKKRG